MDPTVTEAAEHYATEGDGLSMTGETSSVSTKSDVVLPPTASMPRRIVALVGAVALTLVATFLAAWTVLAFADAQVPAGQGWVAGHYYDKSAEQVVESLLAAAMLAAVAVFALVLAFSQIYSALTLRRIPRRWLIALPVIAAVCVFGAALATTANYCDPDVCRDTSGEMH